MEKPTEGKAMLDLAGAEKERLLQAQRIGTFLDERESKLRAAAVAACVRMGQRVDSLFVKLVVQCARARLQQKAWLQLAPFRTKDEPAFSFELALNVFNSFSALRNLCFETIREMQGRSAESTGRDGFGIVQPRSVAATYESFRSSLDGVRSRYSRESMVDLSLLTPASAGLSADQRIEVENMLALIRRHLSLADRSAIALGHPGLECGRFNVPEQVIDHHEAEIQEARLNRDERQLTRLQNGQVARRRRAYARLRRLLGLAVVLGLAVAPTSITHGRRRVNEYLDRAMVRHSERAAPPAASVDRSSTTPSWDTTPQASKAKITVAWDTGHLPARSVEFIHWDTELYTRRDDGHVAWDSGRLSVHSLGPVCWDTDPQAQEGEVVVAWDTGQVSSNRSPEVQYLSIAQVS